MSVNPLSFEVKKSSDWGRFITAQRDYTIGETILAEEPFFVAPSVIKTIRSDVPVDKSTPIITCVGCCKIITGTPRICLECGLAVCCVKCSQDPFHKRYECKLLNNNKIQPKDHITLDRLNLVRACLMFKDKEDPSKWKEFITLSSDIQIQTEHYKQGLQKEIIIATLWINHICKLKVHRNTIGRIIRTFIVNGFTCYEKDENGSSYQAELIFKTGSLFAHSCAPNAEWIILPTDQNGMKRLTLRVYALRNISCYEPITFAYMQEYLSTDTVTRKKLIAEELHFECKCQRCIDPTDLSFYTSALTCPRCKDKHLLQDNLNDENSCWTCGFCGNSVENSVIKGYVQDYEYSLCSIIKDEPCAAWESNLETLLTSSKSKKLTSNHRFFIRATYYWLVSLDFEDLLEYSIASQWKFVKILERAKNCLTMLRMFGTLRSIVCIELVFAYAIASFYFKTKTFRTINYDNYSPEERRQIISAVYKHMNTAVNIMELNPYNKDYALFRDTALSRFRYWEKLFKSLTAAHTVVDIESDDELNSANDEMSAFDNMKMAIQTFWTRAKAYLLSKTAQEVPEGRSRRFPYVSRNSSVFESDFFEPDTALISLFDFYYSN